MEKKEALYREFAQYYDKIYAKRNYLKEVSFIDSIIKKHNRGKSILEVACGTGNHTKLLLKKGYSVVGIDKNKQMLNLAKKKLPQVEFKQGDMRDFNLNKKFDAVLCLFTVINYNLTTAGVIKSLQNFKRHLKEKGVIIFDAPLPQKHSYHADFLDKDSVVLYTRDDTKRISNFFIYWMFRKKGKVEVLRDSHPLRFYTLKEISQAITKAGLKYKVYWNFSLTKKKGRRPVIVCTN
ncbi:MAG: class I SAM-dependent methyltransferase [Nanoarchaeota archaeon]